MIRATFHPLLWRTRLAIAKHLLTPSWLLLLMGAAACSSAGDSNLGAGGAANDAAAGDGAAGQEAAIPEPDDGPASRLACTSDFGNGISAVYGRIDGYLVSIVPPSSKNSCNADSDHVHLQVLMKSKVYDIAVNVADESASQSGVYLLALDAPVPRGVWEEGWHTETTTRLNYPSDFNVHSMSFALMSTTELTKKLEDELKTANHISVFATGYSSGGAHLVHRRGGFDGAIVVHPLSSVPHVLMFRFADQSF